MKKILYILSFLCILTTSSFAQDDDDQGGKIRERMTEYIQKRLSLSKPEADKFGPVFLDYFNQLRKTNQEYKGDKLVLQQKVVEVKLNYRNQFKTIIGEKKSNDVFIYERDFINEIKAIRTERSQNRGNDNRGGGNKGNGK
jgi:hypothetical protein